MIIVKCESIEVSILLVVAHPSMMKRPDLLREWTEQLCGRIINIRGKGLFKKLIRGVMEMDDKKRAIVEPETNRAQEDELGVFTFEVIVEPIVGLLGIACKMPTPK